MYPILTSKTSKGLIMARKSKSENNSAIFIIAALPVIIFSFFFYRKLANTFLNSEHVQRVNDIKRLLYPTITIGTCIFLLFIFFSGEFKEFLKTNSLIDLVIASLFLILFFIIGYFGAKYIAILYLGILFDFENNRIICPYDFESYGINDYLSFNFLKTFTQVRCINVDELTKITRGYGNELYLHGKFGSNKIKMSSKQKRDECLALATELVGKKGITFSELESY